MSGHVKRPPVPEEAVPGTWVAVPQSGWRVTGGKRCRRKLTRHDTCNKPTVAEINRGTTTRPGTSRYSQQTGNWWAYCADHLYGNWIEDGQVMAWEYRPAGDTIP